MPVAKFDLSTLKKACLIRTNLILFFTKCLILFALWQGLKPMVTLNDFWIIPIWVLMGFLIDGFMLLKKPNVFETILLTENEEKTLHIDSAALIRYLIFSPKIRLLRTILCLFLTGVFCVLFQFKDWSLVLMYVLFFGSVLIDPLLKYCFNIQTPLIFQNSSCEPYKPMESLYELHRHDAGWGGSPAWTAIKMQQQ